MADGSGAVTLARSNTPFGGLLSSAGSGASPYGFSGEVRDPSGMTYLRARYYDPQTGRFINRDSFPGSITRPASLHRFTYAENNPVNFTDPSGHYIDTLIDLAFIGYDIHTLIKHLNSGCGDIQSDLLALGLDVGGALLPFATGLGMVARAGSKTDDAIKLVGKLDGVEEAFKSFERWNFRENLRRLTRRSLDDIVGMEAHHIFPKQFEKQFMEAGIENIHTPVLGSWVDATAHRGWSYAYNQRWKVFLKEKSSAEELLNFARNLAEEYGFDVHFGIP